MKRRCLLSDPIRLLTLALVLMVSSWSSAVAAEGRGAVSGVALFDGPRPVRRPIQLVGKDGKPTDCHQLHQDGLLSEDLIVNSRGELANVFVYVRKGVPKQTYPVPAELPVLDQVDCMFRPRVQGIRVGQELLMRNSDSLIHNVRSLSLRNRAFNVAQPAASPDRKKSFRRAEREIRIQCDFHPWMTAYLFVMDHPFFAVSDDSGRFEIEGLPAGDYTLAAWHEELGELRTELKLTERRSAQVRFAFQPKGEQTQLDVADLAPTNLSPTQSAGDPPRKKRRFVKMWKAEDFSTDSSSLEEPSIERGRSVFEEASCIKCHLVDGKGNKFGPELTDVAKRFQGVKLLEQILKPSSEIHKEYQTELVVTDEGKIITGLLLEEKAESVQLLPNPLKPDETIEIPNSSIEQRKTSQLSTMPEGLLMNFERQEILDLLAFLRSNVSDPQPE